MNQSEADYDEYRVGGGEQDGTRIEMIEKKTLGCYKNLIDLIFRPNTIFDRVDDYLIGRRTKLPSNTPPPPLPRTDHYDTQHQQRFEIDDDDKEEEDEEELFDRIMESILRFPVQGLGVLEDRLTHRPYSLMTLFGLVGHRYLIYGFVGIAGIDIRDFDWKHRFKILSKESQLILQSIKSQQSRRRPVSIPRDIQRRIGEIKSRIELQDQQAEGHRADRPEGSTLTTNKRTRSLESDSDQDQQAQARASVPPGQAWNQNQATGHWVGEYFVEDYDEGDEETITTNRNSISISSDNRQQQQRQQQQRVPANHVDRQPDPTAIPNPSTTQSANWNLNQQRKRAKLASLLNPSVAQNNHDGNGPNETTNQEEVRERRFGNELTTTNSNDNNNDNDHDHRTSFTSVRNTTDPDIDMQVSKDPNEAEARRRPPYFIKLDHIPIDASPQSILFFLQNGSDIFRTARTQNQKIDALGRNLEKFRVTYTNPKLKSNHNHHSKRPLGLKSELNKFDTIKYEDLTLLPTTTTANDDDQKDGKMTSHEFRSILIKFDLAASSSSSSSRSELDRDRELDRLHQHCHSFIQEFHAKKFFKFDPLCPKLICRFSSHHHHPSQSNISTEHHPPPHLSH